MKLLKILIIILPFIITQAGFAVSVNEKYTLFADGSTDYKIVVDANAVAGERFAAE